MYSSSRCSSARSYFSLFADRGSIFTDTCTSRDGLALGGREVTAEVCDERWASSQRWRDNFGEGGLML